MITKTDIVLLLTELREMGVDTEGDIDKVFSSSTIPLDILKKIHNHKPLDVLRFYEKLRHSYNQKHSRLYINIVRADENVLTDAKTILTTLSALLNQILQFDVDDRAQFYKFARADEIIKVLELYFKTYDLSPAQKLLTLFKADIKVLDTLKKGNQSR